MVVAVMSSAAPTARHVYVAGKAVSEDMSVANVLVTC
jgi:hypothetical protein